MFKKSVFVFCRLGIFAGICCSLMLAPQASWGFGWGKKKVEPKPPVKQETRLERAQAVAQRAQEDLPQLRKEQDEDVRDAKKILKSHEESVDAINGRIHVPGAPTNDELKEELEAMTQENQEPEDQEQSVVNPCKNSEEKLSKLGILIAGDIQQVRLADQNADKKVQKIQKLNEKLKNKQITRKSFDQEMIQLQAQLDHWQRESSKWQEAKKQSIIRCVKRVKRCEKQLVPVERCKEVIQAAKEQLGIETINNPSISDENGVKSGSPAASSNVSRSPHRGRPGFTHTGK